MKSNEDQQFKRFLEPHEEAEQALHLHKIVEALKQCWEVCTRGCEPGTALPKNWATIIGKPIEGQSSDELFAGMSSYAQDQLGLTEEQFRHLTPGQFAEMVDRNEKRKTAVN